MTAVVLAFFGLSCAGRMEAPPVAAGREGVSRAEVTPGVYILTLDPGVCRDSVIAEAKRIGVDVLYNYVNFNMMAIRIPDTATIERVVGSMPSFRGGFTPDKILELHNDER